MGYEKKNDPETGKERDGDDSMKARMVETPIAVCEQRVSNLVQGAIWYVFLAHVLQCSF